MTTLAAASHAAHGTDPITVILFIFAAAAGYLLSLYVKPTRGCRWCESTGTKLTRTGRPGRGTCGRCHGTGRIRRIGATAVHRFYWSALGNQHRQHRQADHGHTHQHTGYPPN